MKFACRAGCGGPAYGGGAAGGWLDIFRLDEGWVMVEVDTQGCAQDDFKRFKEETDV